MVLPFPSFGARAGLLPGAEGMVQVGGGLLPGGEAAVLAGAQARAAEGAIALADAAEAGVKPAARLFMRRGAVVYNMTAEGAQAARAAKVGAGNYGTYETGMCTNTASKFSRGCTIGLGALSLVLGMYQMINGISGYFQGSLVAQGFRDLSKDLKRGAKSLQKTYDSIWDLLEEAGIESPMDAVVV